MLEGRKPGLAPGDEVTARLCEGCSSANRFLDAQGGDRVGFINL